MMRGAPAATAQRGNGGGGGPRRRRFPDQTWVAVPVAVDVAVPEEVADEVGVVLDEGEAFLSEDELEGEDVGVREPLLEAELETEMVALRVGAGLTVLDAVCRATEGEELAEGEPDGVEAVEAETDGDTVCVRETVSEVEAEPVDVGDGVDDGEPETVGVCGASEGEAVVEALDDGEVVGDIEPVAGLLGV